MCIAVNAQSLNNSFESWNTTSFDEPNGFQTGNHESSNSGLTPVTQVAGHTGYAVRMETIVSNSGDTAEAYIANGDPMSGKGGVPITGNPTGLTGFYRYSLPNNDSALILLVFKQNGIVFSSNAYKIKGSGSQNTFIQFTLPIVLGMTPDTVIFAAASSNLLDNVGVEDGSFLELDDIAFTGINSPIANSAFETWSTQSNDKIIGWESYGEGTTQTTDSYSGTYAISMRTIDYGNGDIGSSGITSGHSSQNGTTGGMPFTHTADTLTGWYKYSSPCTDTAFGSVSTTFNGNYVGGNTLYLTPVSQYTYFEIPIWSNSTPDTIRVNFTSSRWPYDNSCDGSTLIIDDLAMKSEIVAGVANYKKGKALSVYPNPAVNLIHVNDGNSLIVETEYAIYDISGRHVMTTVKLSNSDDALNISTLKSGRYYLRLTSAHGESMTSFTKQ